MPLAVGDQLLVSYRGTLFGQRTLTTFSYVVTINTGAGTPFFQCQDIALWFGTGIAVPMRDDFLALCTPDYNLDAVWVQQVLGVRGAKAVQAVGAVGTRAGTCTTANLCSVLTRRTSLSGRSQISNLHIPAVPTAEQAAGTLDVSYLTDLGIFGDDCVTTLVVPVGGGNVTLDPVVLHKPYGVGRYDVLTNHVENPYVRDMRRRTVGLGE